jgi:hypothetical protein
MSQPTVTTPLPIRPAGGFKRPALMAALALSEYLVAAPVPVPTQIRVSSPRAAGGEAAVECYAHHDLDALSAWQEAFGGEISHEIRGDRQVYSVLSGRAYDAPFELWTLRDITPEQQAAERQMTARWVAENGDMHDWSAETSATYRAVILRYRLAVAA